MWELEVADTGRLKESELINQGVTDKNANSQFVAYDVPS